MIFFPYIEIYVSVQASFLDIVIVALQEVAILNISNATEEVVGKQMTTVVTITNIEKHETSWMQKKKTTRNQNRHTCGWDSYETSSRS